MIETNILNIHLKFETSEEVFSSKGVDKGTLAMLSKVEFDPRDKVLDLGCGYGVVGILAAKLIGPENVVMLDNNPKAVELSRKNAALNGVPDIAIYESDGFANIPEKDTTMIL